MSTRNDSDKIDEELVCVDSFVQRLKEIDSDQMITVCRECNDPPDFWVTIAGRKYAVEVTSIVVDQHYHAPCKKLEESIQAALEASNSIQGTYALDVRRRPELPRRGTTLWNQLITKALQTLQTMSNAPTGTAIPLLKDKLATYLWPNGQRMGIQLVYAALRKGSGKAKHERNSRASCKKRLLRNEPRSRRPVSLKKVLMSCCSSMMPMDMAMSKTHGRHLQRFRAMNGSTRSSGCLPSLIGPIPSTLIALAVQGFFSTVRTGCGGSKESRTLLTSRGGMAKSSGSLPQVAHLTTQWS